MSIGSVYSVAASALLAISALLLVRSGAVLAQIRRWRPLATLWLLGRALVPMWVVHMVLRVQRRTRERRLAIKKYRSLSRRVVRRGVDEFFSDAQIEPVNREQLSLAVVCALGAIAALLLTIAGTENHWPWW
ncbi:MAG TPA: hypothetical protein VFR86_16690 [Burkholderiaceae bacterium]|nr:hypothetical protein [Burkholderiaceae bacterium]